MIENVSPYSLTAANGSIIGRNTFQLPRWSIAILTKRRRRGEAQRDVI